jgi:Family of unknown function (DUF6516)
MTKAVPLRDFKRTLSNGATLQIVIWILPESTRHYPHALKYRLNYSLPDGTSLVRYDNHAPKGDHKHIRAIEQPYKFVSEDKLIADFFDDIVKNGGQL